MTTILSNAQSKTYAPLIDGADAIHLLLLDPDLPDLPEPPLPEPPFPPLPLDVPRLPPLLPLLFLDLLLLARSTRTSSQPFCQARLVSSALALLPELLDLDLRRRFWGTDLKCR